MKTEELTQHAYCVDVAGYTILRNQVHDTDLQTYLKVCKQAADKGGRYAGERCLYCWGPETLKILEHANIDKLATCVMGAYRFWDLDRVSVSPATEGVQYPLKVESPPMNDLEWHRDFGYSEGVEGRPDYLWFFVCLTDINDENGATWIVPGSHRESQYKPKAFDEEESKKWVASAVQVRANGGDIVVLNPRTFHAAGRNYTSETRWIMSVGLTSRSEPARYNHWKIAEPIREGLTEQVKGLLEASETCYDTDLKVKPILPEGWPVSP